ncbi:YhcB family protein [Actinomadura madurae]|uniref:YhcB family protein n=1 Tax=Actinomadura madurae TaxID=1993 RepID=UPI002026E13E|nr:YhcB family protein [Actinomadura madurae]URN00444.1 YhcB family protein [Actinomadura madurae]
MTTTSRRPPARTPKKRAPERPDGAAPPKKAPAKKAPPKKAPEKKAPVKDAPSRGGSAAAKTAKATGTAAKAAPANRASAKSAKPAASRRTAQAAPRTPFVLLIVGLLGGALVSLLLLNTVLAKDAFTLTRLQQSNKQLEQQRQAYEEEIAREGSPRQLSNKAEALGMKKGEDPAFFSTDTGRPSGARIRAVPHAAAASAGAAGVLGVPGTVVPGDGVPPADTRTGAGQGAGHRTGQGTGNGAP